jgi:hypothetical protein
MTVCNPVRETEIQYWLLEMGGLTGSAFHNGLLVMNFLMFLPVFVVTLSLGF